MDIDFNAGNQLLNNLTSKILLTLYQTVLRYEAQRISNLKCFKSVKNPLHTLIISLRHKCIICGSVINDTCTPDSSRYPVSWWWCITNGLVLCNCLWFVINMQWRAVFRLWCWQLTPWYSWKKRYTHRSYSISQEICTRFLLCCALCGYTLTDSSTSIRLTSLALWQSYDCPSASTATLMNMDKYFMWIHYKRLHNHNKAKHNKTVCIILGIYCIVIWNRNNNSHYRTVSRPIYIIAIIMIRKSLFI